MNDQSSHTKKIKSNTNTIAENKYLTFLLDVVEYGIPISKVREIIGRNNIMPLPETNSYVLGIINLRGKIIPILDLRLRFHVHAKDFDIKTCIIIIERIQQTPDGPQTLLIGLLVDEVMSVTNINNNQIDQTSLSIEDIHHSYLKGIAKSDRGQIVILDIDHAIQITDIPANQLTQNV